MFNSTLATLATNTCAQCKQAYMRCTAASTSPSSVQAASAHLLLERLQRRAHFLLGLPAKGGDADVTQLAVAAASCRQLACRR